jgi:hypothetical protein
MLVNRDWRKIWNKGEALRRWRSKKRLTNLGEEINWFECWTARIRSSETSEFKSVWKKSSIRQDIRPWSGQRYFCKLSARPWKWRLLKHSSHKLPGEISVLICNTFEARPNQSFIDAIQPQWRSLWCPMKISDHLDSVSDSHWTNYRKRFCDQQCVWFPETFDNLDQEI